MDIEEQKIRTSRILSRTNALENLLANDDFLKWKDETVGGLLESMKKEILGVDRTLPDWKERVCDAIALYQESSKVYDKVFTLAGELAKRKRDEFKKLSEAPE